MTERQKAALNVERIAEGRYEWVVTSVEGDIGTMPQRKRSLQSYPSEQEARAAGERELEHLRVS